jgi:NTP pyrophosphatase (non-canonical NTP hydrolase)
MSDKTKPCQHGAAGAPPVPRSDTFLTLVSIEAHPQDEDEQAARLFAAEQAIIDSVLYEALGYPTIAELHTVGTSARLVEMESRPRSIAELAEQTYEINHANGWWSDVDIAKMAANDPDRWLVLLALIHSEASEAVEDVRDGCFAETATDSGKPVGLPSELADVVIRVFDACHGAGIDLQGAIERKLAYNATRKHRHGGKAR